nr:reverse transcriptase domain-containing protein [Tanacetum cinerariifolium]
MVMARKRVGLLPTHHLVVRHSVDYSSSDHFALDDSLSDSSLSSSSSSSPETSLDPSLDKLSDSLFDHSLLAPSSGMRHSHHLCSLLPSIPYLSVVISDRPSHDSSSHCLLHMLDLLPSPKRIRSPESATDLEGCSKDGFEPYVPREDGLGVDIEDECSDSSRYRGTDLEIDDDVEIETGARGPVKVRVDRVTHPVIADEILEPAQEEGVVEVMYETLGDLRDKGHMIVATGQQNTGMLERIRELERVNMRLRDMMDVARSGASWTRKGVNEQIDPRLTGALRARDAAENLEPLMGNERNRNEGNGNGNGNGGGNGYKFKGFMLARDALTWWNSHKRIIRIEAAYAISWGKLIKLMTEVYCLRNEVQKMETKTVYCEMWKLLGHFRKDFPKLRNQNHGNQTGNKNGNKTGNQTGGNKATIKAYAIGGGGANLDSNVVMSTFLLNNYYASMLFDSGADRSFVPSTFIALLDVAPSTLDTSYAVELADGRIS